MNIFQLCLKNIEYLVILANICENCQILVNIGEHWGIRIFSLKNFGKCLEWLWWSKKWCLSFEMVFTIQYNKYNTIKYIQYNKIGTIQYDTIL